MNRSKTLSLNSPLPFNTFLPTTNPEQGVDFPRLAADLNLLPVQCGARSGWTIMLCWYRISQDHTGWQHWAGMGSGPASHDQWFYPVIDVRHVSLNRKVFNAGLKSIFPLNSSSAPKLLASSAFNRLYVLAITWNRVDVCFQWITEIFIEHFPKVKSSPPWIHFVTHIKIADLGSPEPKVTCNRCAESKS